MKVGTQIHAPTGYAGLSAGQTFYFLASKGDPARVFIVHLWQRQHKMCGGGKRTLQGAEIIAIQRDAFERAVNQRLIVETDHQSPNPPWLSEYSTDDLRRHLEMRSTDAKRIDVLVSDVKRTTSKLDQVLRSRDPLKEINRAAATCNINSARYRLAVCVYLLFGERPEVLLSQKFRCGKYDRDALPAGTRKLGRTNKRHGKDSGFHIRAGEKKRIEAYVRANLKHGVKMTDLYRACMRVEFGCKARGNGWKHLFHPEGKPFPTKRQFDYVAKQTIGTRAIQIARFGVERIRNKIAGSRGSYTEHISNLHQCVEGDGYTTSQHPTGINGEVLPKITVVRIIDSLSRMRLGIGFSMNGERASAYDMALCCMAMDKVEFCALFGLAIESHEWPSEGWPSRKIVDRGAGAAIEIDKIAFEELTPAYAPQSKSLVESSQRKQDDISGPPSHLITARTAVELCVEEIQKLVVENNTVPVKLPPRLVACGVKPTPVGVWSVLEECGRNDAFDVPLFDAIKLLPEIKVKCTKDGVEYFGEMFRSKDLQDSGLLDQAKREGHLTLTAHLMPMCVRQFWLVHKSALLPVQWSLPFSDGESQTRLTLDELSTLNKLNLENAARLKEHHDAYVVEMDDRYEETFGERPGRVSRRSGRAKVRTPSARAQTSAIQKVAEGR